MANHKATKKDVRQAAKRRDRNRYYGKTTRNAIRDLKAITDIFRSRSHKAGKPFDHPNPYTQFCRQDYPVMYSYPFT